MGEFIGLIAVISSVALPIIGGIILGLKWMGNRHAERIGLINQGIIPPDSSPQKKSDPNRLVSLRNGIVLIALGIGIIVGFLCTEYLAIGMGRGFWMTGASVVFFLGVGYLVYFLVVQRMPVNRLKEEAEQE